MTCSEHCASTFPYEFEAQDERTCIREIYANLHLARQTSFKSTIKSDTKSDQKNNYRTNIIETEY